MENDDLRFKSFIGNDIWYSHAEPFVLSQRESLNLDFGFKYFPNLCKSIDLI